ncbi:hypothetical protein KIW84_014484 [Lathyrus oleraceus]|uniref:Squalene monooxygenase n=1 Tax=Pisum sativum TaxID=3888 RepID=A0A9D5GZ62_PEA|nr:hypothetical protein KIW84_014484 [Pisum sativum]
MVTNLSTYTDCLDNAALAYTLEKDGRRVHVIERGLSESDRIVGELLQPSGYLKLLELGLEDCMDEIDAQRVFGYSLYKDGKNTKLSYPLENFDSDVEVPSHFVGLILENCNLPYEDHGHVILGDPSPILFYPISSTEIRCLVDVPGQKLPSVGNGEMANYLKTVVAPQLVNVDSSAQWPVSIDAQESCSNAVLLGFGIVEKCTKHDTVSNLLKSGTAEPHSSSLLYPNDKFNIKKPLLYFLQDYALTSKATVHLDGQTTFTDAEIQMKDLLPVVAESYLSKSLHEGEKHSMLVPHFSRNVAMTITKMMKPMIDILYSLNRKLLSTILLSSPTIMLVRMAIDEFGTAAVRNAWALVEFTAATLLDEESNIPAYCTQNTRPAITSQFKPSNVSKKPAESQPTNAHVVEEHTESQPTNSPVLEEPAETQHKTTPKITGRGSSWLQKESWTQLVNNDNNSFRISQILSDITFPEQTAEAGGATTVNTTTTTNAF